MTIVTARFSNQITSHPFHPALTLETHVHVLACHCYNCVSRNLQSIHTSHSDQQSNEEENIKTSIYRANTKKLQHIFNNLTSRI